MTNAMHRFFLTEQAISVDQTVELAAISHQLQSVLRLQPGVVIGLLDGHGHLYETEILSLERKRGSGRVLNKIAVETEPLSHLTLYQCSLKADKFEWVLQKGTELGVSKFVPVISERSIVRPATALTKKYERWQKIIQEAAEQSGRGRLPQLASPVTISEALNTDDVVKILPWEAAAFDSSISLNKLLSSQSVEEFNKDATAQVSLFIGPEGGLTEAEAQSAEASGWTITSLGPRILRAETAAIASIAIIINTLG